MTYDDLWHLFSVNIESLSFPTHPMRIYTRRFQSCPALLHPASARLHVHVQLPGAAAPERSTGRAPGLGLSGTPGKVGADHALMSIQVQFELGATCATIFDSSSVPPSSRKLGDMVWGVHGRGCDGVCTSAP